MPYSFESFTVSGANTYPNSLNSNGDCCGCYQSDGFQGFIRTADGTITTFSVPSMVSTYPCSINDSGQIAGWCYDIDDNEYGFFRDSDGTVTTFQPDGTGGTPVYSGGTIFMGGNRLNQGAACLNNAGGIIFSYEDTSGTIWIIYRDPSGAFSLILTSTDSNQPAWGALNESAEICYTFNPNSEPSTNWQTNLTTFGMITIPGGSGLGVYGWSINDAGIAAGYYQDSVDFLYHGWVCESGVVTIFDAEEAGGVDLLYSNAINNSGMIAGAYTSNFDFNTYGFVRAIDGTFTGLISAFGSNDTEIADINDSGIIVGFYVTGASHVGFISVEECFDLSVTPVSGFIYAGDQGQFKVDVTNIPESCDLGVTLSVSGLPFGVSGSFSVNPIYPPTGSSILTLDIGALVPGFSAFSGGGYEYEIVVIAEGCGCAKWTTIGLDVGNGYLTLQFPKQPSQISFVLPSALNDVGVRVKKTDIYGEGAWSYLSIPQADFIQSGFLRGQGSVIPSLDNEVDALFTYTSTDDDIVISWPDFVIGYADGSFQGVSAGSFDSGATLSPSTTYYVFPKVYCTNGSPLLFDTPNGDSAFITAGSPDLITAANDVQADGWISLAGQNLSFSVMTAAGGGAGGGSGGGGTCVVKGSNVQTPRGLVKAEDVCVDDLLRGADPRTGSEIWAAVDMLNFAVSDCISIKLQDGSVARISKSTPCAVLKNDELQEVAAGRITTQCQMFSEKSWSWQPVVEIHNLGIQEVVRFVLKPQQWFFSNGVLGHNNRVSKY